jgi:Holliday junction resolvasome RuvABC endonuclease subunit
MPEPLEKYPGSYVTWAYAIFAKILEKIEFYKPDVLVIEETSGGSKSAYSQKILEFSHFLLAKFIKETGIKSVYFQTETWRRIVGCLMNKAEKDNNKQRTALKKKNPDIQVIKNENGKRLGKIGRKHVNVRRANELLGKFLQEPLILAQEDQADALLLATAYHMKKVQNE